MYPLPHLFFVICHGAASYANGQASFGSFLTTARLLAIAAFYHSCDVLDAKVFRQPLITYRDANIGVEQSVGSPPQKLRLVVDLSSDNSGRNGSTRIVSACCFECCSQRRFVPWKSSSFREIRYDHDMSVLAEDVTQVCSASLCRIWHRNACSPVSEQVLSEFLFCAKAARGSVF